MKADSVWGSGKSCLVYRGAQRHGPTGRAVLTLSPFPWECDHATWECDRDLGVLTCEFSVTINALDRHLGVPSKPFILKFTIARAKARREEPCCPWGDHATWECYRDLGILTCEFTVTINVLERHLRVCSKPFVFTRSVLLGMQGQPIRSIGYTPSWHWKMLELIMHGCMM